MVVLRYVVPAYCIDVPIGPPLHVGVFGSQEAEYDTLAVNRALPLRPFFVVIKITPFPARDP